MNRVYLDHNATTPLRSEARDAMLAAMDLVGNPASVHAEGRAAKMLLERARGQVASLVGCDVSEVIFTSGASEAIATCGRDASGCVGSDVEHEAVRAWIDAPAPLVVDGDGVIDLAALSDGTFANRGDVIVYLQSANSETGVVQPAKLADHFARLGLATGQVVRDAVQAAGKLADLGRWQATTGGWHARLCLSAHKLGGPKGVGALIAGPDYTPGAMQPMIRGGGQEKGRRSGTENLIGIAGFGAAAEAAQRDLAAGRWDEVSTLRDLLEQALEAASATTTFVGRKGARLPNTSCLITPGWKGETQVMQMDLAGFAISAGSACSSGKVKPSAVLRAMGYDETQAASAIRVSLGLETTRDNVLRFADAWTATLKKHETRAA